MKFVKSSSATIFLHFTASIEIALFRSFHSGLMTTSNEYVMHYFHPSLPMWRESISHKMWQESQIALCTAVFFLPVSSRWQICEWEMHLPFFSSLFHLSIYVLSRFWRIAVVVARHMYDGIALGWWDIRLDNVGRHDTLGLSCEEAGSILKCMCVSCQDG